MKTTILAFLFIWSTNLLIAQNDNFYTDFIVGKITRDNFTENGEVLVRKYAAKFVELYQSGTLYEVFSTDALKNTYTIDFAKMPYKFRNYNWQGVKVERNLRGQFNGTTEEYYNSVLISFTIEFIQYYPKRVPLKEIVGISELFDYVSAKYYGKNKNLCWAKWREIASLDQRKAILMQYSKELSYEYSAYAIKNSDWADYKDLDKVKDLIIALETNDWKQIESAANKMGWTYNTYLYY